MLTLGGSDVREAAQVWIVLCRCTNCSHECSSNSALDLLMIHIQTDMDVCLIRTLYARYSMAYVMENQIYRSCILTK